MDTKVADPLYGALLSGRYRITRRLARGGTTTVYQARDERLDRPVAIRIINPEYVVDVEVLDRLAGEAQTVAHLGHPNVVAVYDQGTHEGVPFVVMEYVKGRTLREILTERGRLNPAESLAVIEQVLAALAVAHRNGLVHRGVRPENILVAPPPNGSGDLVDAVVKVADFGLARTADVARSQASPLVGAQYLAPEFIADGRADVRADVYSAGVVLFEMLTGRVPFPERGGPSAAAYPGGLDVDAPTPAAWRHVSEEVPPPSRVADGIAPRLDDLVVRATRRSPSMRPRDAAEFLALTRSARDDIGMPSDATRSISQATVVVPAVGAGSAGAGRGPIPAPRASGRAGAGVGARVHGADGPPSVGERVREAPNAASEWLRVTWHRLRYTRRGRQQLAVVAVVVGILIAVGGWWFGAGRYTQAPDLTGLSKDNAISEAERLGFTVAFGSSIFSETAEPDTVLVQEPPAGGRVLRGGTITLYLSKGPERYVVPDIVGQELNFARSRIASQLLIEEVDGYSDTLPVGYVAATEPPAGTVLAPGETVTIIVVTGPWPVHVPDVVGRLLPEAESMLRSAGFRNITVSYRDDDQPQGTVLEQTPGARTGMASADGVQVELVVSNGPALPMPELIGVECQAAVDQLAALGVIGVTDVAPDQRPGKFVSSQSVATGHALVVGQTVNLTCTGPA